MKTILPFFLVLALSGCAHIERDLTHALASTDSKTNVHQDVAGSWDCFKGVVRGLQVLDFKAYTVRVGTIQDLTQTFSSLQGGEVPAAISDSVRSAIAELGPALATRADNETTDLTILGSIQAFDRAIASEEVRRQGGIGWSIFDLPGNITDGISTANYVGEITINLIVYDRNGKSLLLNQGDFTAKIFDNKLTDEWGASFSLLNMGERKTISVRKGRFAVLKSLIYIALIDRLSYALAVSPNQCLGNQEQSPLLADWLTRTSVGRSKVANIRAIQKTLISHGFGDIKINGDWDVQTRKAASAAASITSDTPSTKELDQIFLTLALKIPPMEINTWKNIRREASYRRFLGYDECILQLDTAFKNVEITNLGEKDDRPIVVMPHKRLNSYPVPCGEILISSVGHFPPVREMIEFGKEKKKTVVLRAPPKSVTLTVSGNDVIYIDGKVVGKAPVRVTIAKGKYMLQCANMIRDITINRNKQVSCERPDIEKPKKS